MIHSINKKGKAQSGVYPLIKFLVGTLSLILLIKFIGIDSVNAESPFVLPSIDQVVAIKSNASLDELINDLPDSIDFNDPLLVLVNKENPREKEFSIDFAYSAEGFPYASAISQPYQELLQAGLNAGYAFRMISGYRSMNEQAANREGRIQSYLSAGYSEKDALELTNQYYAPANATEHLTGLAIDLLGNDWVGGLSGDYGYYGSAIWLSENAHRYGFILRYLEGKSDFTGYNYEPWHIRYVGKEHAEYMYQHGLSFEEYLALWAEKMDRATQKVQESEREDQEASDLALFDEWHESTRNEYQEKLLNP